MESRKKNIKASSQPFVVFLSLGSVLSLLVASCAIGFTFGRNGASLLFYFDLVPHGSLEETSNDVERIGNFSGLLVGSYSDLGISINLKSPGVESNTTMPTIWNNAVSIPMNLETNNALSIVREEMFILPALLAHPDPKQVAIVSSDAEPLKEQVLKHKWVGATMLEDVSQSVHFNDDGSKAQELNASAIDMVRIDNRLESESFTRLMDLVFLDQ